ncbi:hypothetical protein GCM10011380_18410 [Sphingomonas metalli]|uniref:Uncharacterized protein n=1 Tax=Sphingomonas metalli TaxID=1779358 RepID=A0A916T372_9SPHN|nr:hypothetical protein [Sphingomonas metalli]GGB29229.1 hypothetical protein GCM10011380_18410 [Sphingomonas metalli]
MNDSTASAPGSSLLPDGIAAITSIHIVLMAIVAIAAIAIIVAGARRKRQRVEAKRAVEERAAEVGLTPSVPEPGPLREETPAIADAAPPPPAPVEAAVDEPMPVDPAPLADEPIAAAAPMDASPASVAADIPAATEPGSSASPADGPITQLKGLGPKLADRLAGLGITTVGQMAALTDDEAAALDAQLGPFAGRMARDRWIEQSRFLAAGDRAGFEAVFGRL